MSGWEAYINMLIDSKFCTKAGIFGLDGKEWAKTKDWAIKQEEIDYISAILTGKEKNIKESPKILGEKCIILKQDEDSIYAKKGKSGFCATKTKLGFIIGWYDDPIVPGRCNLQVQKVCDYLKEKNC
eukprot:EC820375.1.p1 GENE.EC820375.1~~EC820375.1.p1  ORF type:complete len:127 (+),score=69.28 EC820375.1:44-424(+)